MLLIYTRSQNAFSFKRYNLSVLSKVGAMCRPFFYLCFHSFFALFLVWFVTFSFLGLFFVLVFILLFLLVIKLHARLSMLPSIP